MKLPRFPLLITRLLLSGVACGRVWNLLRSSRPVPHITPTLALVLVCCSQGFDDASSTAGDDDSANSSPSHSQPAQSATFPEQPDSSPEEAPTPISPESQQSEFACMPYSPCAGCSTDGLLTSCRCSSTGQCAAAECSSDDDCSDRVCVETWTRRNDACGADVVPTFRCTRSDDPCSPGVCADSLSFCAFSDVTQRFACIPLCPG